MGVLFQHFYKLLTPKQNKEASEIYYLIVIQECPPSLLFFLIFTKVDFCYLSMVHYGIF